MKAFLVVSCLVLGLIGASITHAQTTLAACNLLTRTMYYGMSGTDVSNVQRFLIGTGHLRGIAATGYFGVLTRDAVTAYQISRGISAVGSVGPLTRAAINGEMCRGAQSAGQSSTSKAPVIDYLSTTSGPMGTEVTIYGSNFDVFNNSVVFGNISLTGFVGTSSITFKVPQQTASCPQYSPVGCIGTSTQIVPNTYYDVYVVSRGQVSNTYQFYVTNPKYLSSRPSIVDSITPYTLQVNTQGLWAFFIRDRDGRSVTASVDWGDDSTQTSGKSFAVQGTQPIIFTHQYKTTGTYTITITVIDDDSGYRTVQDAMVQIVSQYSPSTNDVFLVRMLPDTIQLGGQLLIEGRGFTPYGNNLTIGQGVIKNITSYNNGTLLYISMPTVIDPCLSIEYGTCTAFPITLKRGESYTASVTNAQGRKSSTWYIDTAR